MYLIDKILSRTTEYLLTSVPVDRDGAIALLYPLYIFGYGKVTASVLLIDSSNRSFMPLGNVIIVLDIRKGFIRGARGVT